MPSTIDTDADVVTLINVFTVDPARLDDLVACLTEATEATIRHRPGFVSANIHAALDGTRVANYAQWASVGHLQAMLADPDCQPHLGAASALASADPQLYTVVSVHSA